jgi:O-antigen ligase
MLALEGVPNAYPARVHAVRRIGHPAAGTAAATLLPSLVVAGLLGWLVVHEPLLAIGLAAAVVAVPLLLASGLSVRGTAIAVALAGHLFAGPAYVRGAAPGWLPLLLDLGVLAAFGLLVFEPQARPRPWRVAVLALAAVVLLEAFNPLLPSFGYGITGARALAVPLLLLVAVGTGRLTRIDERVLIAIGVLGWLLNVAFAAKQWLIGFSGAELEWILSTRSTYLVGDQIRLLGATRSNQDFAFLVAIAFPAVCACALASGRSKRWRIGFGLLLLGTLAVLFGSLVRSGLVAGVAGALVVAVVMARDANARWRMVASGVGLAVLVWIVATAGLGLALSQDQTQTLQTRVSSIFSPGDDYAVNQRQTVVWPRAVRAIEQHLLGAGAGSAGPLSQARDDAPLGPLVPDNGYLLVAVQFGIVGLLLFLGVLALLAVELWRRARAGGLAAAAGLGALVALCVAMLTGNFISLISPSCAWAVLVGLGLRTERAE